MLDTVSRDLVSVGWKAAGYASKSDSCGTNLFSANCDITFQDRLESTIEVMRIADCTENSET